MTEESSDTTVRLLVLCAGDPELDRTFSGSARNLIYALERRGIVHAKGNVTRGFTDVFSPPPLHVRAAAKLDKFNLIDKYRSSRMARDSLTRNAKRFAARNPGYNAVLMYGTNYHPRLPAPTYCYFDATVAQNLNGQGWEFSTMPSKKAARIFDEQKEVFDYCTGIFPRTEWAADSVIHDYNISKDKLCVAGAGANHNEPPIPHGGYDNKTILFIGREWERKGGPLILDAFRRARKSIPDAKLRIIGCEPPLNEPGVTVIGAIRKDDGNGLRKLLEHYSQASLFCIMSSFEPFGIVIIEAQHSYVPCVVPARFAFTETVRDGETGRHISTDDPVELGDAFVELLGDPDQLKTMGQAAHAFVQEHFTWDAAARRIHQRIASDIAHDDD